MVLLKCIQIDDVSHAQRLQYFTCCVCMCVLPAGFGRCSVTARFEGDRAFYRANGVESGRQLHGLDPAAAGHMGEALCHIVAVCK